MQPHPLHALAAHMRDSFGITPLSNGEDMTADACAGNTACRNMYGRIMWTAGAKERFSYGAALHLYGSRILLFDLPCDVIAQGLLRQTQK